jgi:chromosome partitioning protein
MTPSRAPQQQLQQVNRDLLERVLAIINGKGGVFKTTLTSNLAGMLAASGFRTLVIDLDPQGNMAEDLGYEDDPRNDEGRALAQALLFGGQVEPMRSIRTNLDVFAGGVELEQATAGLIAKANKDPDGAKLALARFLEPIASDYDMILIDCPPGDEQLQTNAVAAARYALVPVKSDKSSRKGLTAVAHRLDAVLSVNPGLDLLGVVLTGVGTNSSAIERTARQKIAELFNSEDVVFTATIRHSEATAQASRERGLLAYELDAQNQTGPKWWEQLRGDKSAIPAGPRTAGSVADDLAAIAQEVVARITVAETGKQEGTA